MDIYSCVALCLAIIGATIVIVFTSDIGDAIIRKKMNLPPIKKEPSTKNRILDYLLKDNYNYNNWSSIITKTKHYNTSENNINVDLDCCQSKNNSSDKNSFIYNNKFFIETPYNTLLHCSNEKYTFIIGDITITCSKKNLKEITIKDNKLKCNYFFQLDLEKFHGETINMDEYV